MNDPEQALPTPRPRSSENMLARVWRRVGNIQQEFAESPWFGEHRFDDQIHELRDLLANALTDPKHLAGRVDAQAFRNYHDMNFLRYSLDAIVYAPQLRYAARDDIPFFRDVFALNVQYGATQALVRIVSDPLNGLTKEHWQRSAGFGNEMVPLTILNRPAIVRHYNEVTLPASKREDERRAIDLKTYQFDGIQPATLIQAKTHFGPDDHIPRGVLGIQAGDFGNQKQRTQQIILREQIEGVSEQSRRDLNIQATLLRHQIERLKARAHAKTHSGRVALQQTIETPRPEPPPVDPLMMSLTIGEAAPALGNLLEQLTEAQREQAS